MNDGVDEYIFCHEDDREYFCKDCKQLRLWVKGNRNGVDSCGNCGGSNLVIGKPGDLNKEELLKELE